ncbi:hypothetical protein [Caballeronia sp. ATUFL_F1_KS4A]|uniref:hypothetical protein n=1 Tax=Caballeronia sp. ATUFL_F1_KS4A TaxID=2921768 RepID=UPI0020296BCD|nr:hypothetical protein [Caballeronia sp. ATUFL_F1_KS4A]
MTNDFTAIGTMGEARPASESGERGERCAVSANAARVLETTRRAWTEATAQELARRAPRATQPKKRVVPRRSRWPSLVAALNYWSPKPL